MTMRVNGGLYPALNRFFATSQEFADECGMSRKRVSDCLRGNKEFKATEKNAIVNAIIAKAALGQIEGNVEEFLKAKQDFDKYFRKGA